MVPRIKLLLILLIISTSIYAQRITYSYDATGNMIKKEIVMSRSNPIDPQVKPYSEILSSKEVKIYPNPTEGRLKIEILNLNEEDQCSLEIYNLSGTRIIHTSDIRLSNELDITSQPDGIYFLKINLNQKISSWKIIKK